MDEIIKATIEAAVVALVPILFTLLFKLLKKANVSISAENQAMIEKAAQDLILSQEETVAAMVKAGIKPTTDKLTAVTAGLIQKFPNITQTEAEQIVHQELPKVGVGAAATFRAITSAAKS